MAMDSVQYVSYAALRYVTDTTRPHPLSPLAMLFTGHPQGAGI